MRNVLITGIPRSGTTLAAALIDALPDAVCLNEPAWQVAQVASSPEHFARWLIGDFVMLRRRLLAGEPVGDRRAPDGSALTNYFTPGTQRMEQAFAVVPFTRPGLTPDFTLAVKHNGPYLAVLKALAETGFFTIVALVRHPVEVIASWRRLALPISEGRMPNATPFWPRMADITTSGEDLLVRQVKMYDLMCRRIHALQTRIHVLTYERLTARPSLLLDCIGCGRQQPAPLIDRKKSAIPEAERRAIRAALVAHGEHYRQFYPDLEAN